ncbi:wax ester/triacylglycerol synthase family O-acyltransferase [Agromyces tropicus]|uniref:diacylglycerol O-acyltransferase n=1 Tax=Agromyces tropicus TaxID=555371 RepID=A0ABN2UES5_9MICO
MVASASHRERLSPADASNLVIDAPDQVNAFLMAGILAPGGAVGPDGAVDVGAVRSALAARIPALPRLAQRVVRRGRVLEWEPVDADLDDRVRLVDPVDGVHGLETRCARLMVAPMPTDRPLWELLLVPGLGRGRVGMVLRIHHALADGVAAVRLVERVLAAADDDGAGRQPDPVGGSGPARRSFASMAASVASGIGRTSGMLRRPVAPTVLLGRIGAWRGVAFAEAPIGGLAAGAATVGASLNDALLAAVAAATETALRARGEAVPDVLPASVPVALPARGRSGNAVGVMLVQLPTGEPDAGRRLERIAALTRDAKDDARRRGTFELTRTRLGARVFLRLARRQRLVVMFVTNVRGPTRPLALAGARLERAWPVSAIQGDVRLGVAALSYDGMLHCSVHCDAEAVDAHLLAGALRSEFARIAELAA